MMIKEIQRLFNLVIKHSQHIDGEVCSDEIFETWAKNKSHFIEKWGGLTYEIDEEIVLDLPREDKVILFQDYISDAAVFAIKGRLVKDFLISQGVDSLYENKVSVPFDKDGIKINAGAKISKSLKFFFDDKLLLDKFQIRLSRMIQDCKISGKMVMSVHPLDFLSSSETAHNWHSCHALDGEYRSGNLSYMQDKHTFMIYLKADKDQKLPNFPEAVPWNSKKWRVLMYISEDEQTIVSGRQYPFSSANAFYIATKKLIGKFYDLNTFNDWETIPHDKMYKIMEDGIGALQYNDCLNSPSYVPVAMLTEKAKLELENDIYERMTIGEAVPCLECGGMNVSLSDDVRCDECGDYTYCEHCGEACQEGELYYLEGELVCECCWEENGIYCEGCEDTFNEFKTEMFWDEETESYYCEDCYDSIMEYREQEKGCSCEEL